jgi:hypothetical protein
MLLPIPMLNETSLKHSKKEKQTVICGMQTGMQPSLTNIQQTKSHRMGEKCNDF